MAKASRQVFISAAKKDEAWARSLSDRLKKAGFDTWVSSSLVLPGDNSLREIGEALDRSDAMVVLVSPESMKSAWVRREIRVALSERRFEGRLMPVLIRRTSSEEIPWTFGALEWAKGSPIEVARQISKMLKPRSRRKAAARKAASRGVHARRSSARAEAR